MTKLEQCKLFSLSKINKLNKRLLGDSPNIEDTAGNIPSTPQLEKQQGEKPVGSEDSSRENSASTIQGRTALS